jgi:hypothetical protein
MGEAVFPLFLKQIKELSNDFTDDNIVIYSGE